MPGGRILLLLALALSVGLSILLFTTNFIEAGIKDSPIEVQCNPDEDDSCDEVQSASNKSNSTARQASGPDETRSSGSVKGEGQDTIQVDELGGNQSGQPNTPGGKPDIETQEPLDKIKVTFDHLNLHTNFEADEDCQNPESDPCTDSWRNGGEYTLVAYVQGKKLTVFEHYGYEGIGYDQPGYLWGGYLQDKEIIVGIPKGTPLSIIIVGYERDACSRYEFPSQIEDSVNEALSSPSLASTVLGYPKLKTIEMNLRSHVNDGCVQLQNRHDLFPGINKVNEPLSGDIHLGEGTHAEIGSLHVSGYQPRELYELRYTISYHPTYAPELDD